MPTVIKHQDLEIVDRALRESRNHAYNHRYGGLGHLYNLCCQALESLERIRAEIDQPVLFKIEDPTDEGSK